MKTLTPSTVSPSPKLDVTYSPEIVTPHIKWADPYIHGPIHPFIVTGVHTGRGVVELMQRLSLEPRVMSIDPDFDKNRWWGERYRYDPLMNSEPHEYQAMYEILAAELAAPTPYDALVMHAIIGWNDMPKSLRQRIYQRVRNGEGLVLVHPQLGEQEADKQLWDVSPLINVPSNKLGRRARQIEPSEAISDTPWQKATDHYVVNGLPFEALPYPALRHYQYELAPDAQALATDGEGAPVIAVKQYGKGRVVGLGYYNHALWPQLTATRGELNENFWEYLCAILMRAIIWAAKKEPPVQLVSVTPSAKRFAPAKVAGGKVTAHLLNAGTAAPASVAVTVRDEFRREEQTQIKRVTLTPGEHEVTVSLPKDIAAGGRHFVDVIVSTGGKKNDWGSGIYEVGKVARMRKVVLDTDAVKIGATLSGTVKITGNPTGLTLVAELWDLAGRLLGRSTTKAKATATTFKLKVLDSPSNTGWVVCRLLDGDRFVDESRASLALTQPRPGWTDYEVQMPWHHHGVYPWSYVIEEQYQRGGITSTADPTLNFWMTADLHGPGFGIGWWERHGYIKQKQRYGETKDKKYLIRHPCFHTEEFRKPVRDALRKRIPPMLKYSPRVYYISDESSVTCYEDAFDLCWGPATLVAFRQWLKKEYGSLDALNREWDTHYQEWEKVIPATWEEAQARGNPAPWVDHRVFMNRVFAGGFDYAAHICRSIDPVGLVTVSGTQLPSSHNGCDWWLVDNVIDYLQPYSGGGQDEMHRSFNPKLIITGFTAYERYGITLEHEIWHRFFHGHAGASIFWGYSMINPDLVLNAQGQSMHKAFGELRNEGIYRTIRQLTRDNNGIAMHYSMTSGHVWWVQDGKLNYQDLEYGRSTSASFRRFIENRTRWSQTLEDLGYQYDYLPYSRIEAGDLKKFNVLILPGSIALSEKEVEQIKSFVKAGGLILADVPPGTTDGHGKPLPHGALADIFAAGRYGKGRAVLLDQWLTDTPGEARKKKPGQMLRAKVKAALEASGLRPSVTVTGQDGAPPVGIERVSWKDDTVEVVGLLRELEGSHKTRQDGIVEFIPSGAAAQAAPITVRFATTGHVYDLRAHHYLGAKQTVKTSLTGGEPRLYGWLSYKVDGLALSLPRKTAAGDVIKYQVHLRAKTKQFAKHVVKIEVVGPDKKKRAYYSTTVETKNGKASGQFSLALNDQSGVWKIVATDNFSGQQAGQTLTVD